MIIYSQFQKFIATILLLSVLLQSCGSPNCKIIVPEYRKTNGNASTYEDHTYFGAANNRRDEGENVIGLASVEDTLKKNQSSETPVSVIRKTLDTSSANSSLAPHHQSGTFSSTLGPIVPAERKTQTPESSSGNKNSLQRGADVPRHAVPNNSSPDPNKRIASDTLLSISPLDPENCATLPIKRLKGTPPAIITTYKEKNFLLKPIDFTNTFLGPFELSQGKEIKFTRVSGYWTALVKETWGTFSKEAYLPVLCKGDVYVLLKDLEGQRNINIQKRIHVLDTHQTPRAPKVVYVGAMGLRGGGNVGSGLKSAGRVSWGVVSFPFNALAYAFKDKTLRLPCHVTTLSKYDAYDPNDREVDNTLTKKMTKAGQPCSMPLT